jgi:localization factor PodJL
MNKHLSRDKRLNYDAREAARAAARRSGKSLDEWLEDAIFEKAEAALHDGDQLDDDDNDDRLSAITRRVEQAADRSLSAPENALRGSRDGSSRRYQKARDPDVEEIVINSAAIAARHLHTAKSLQDMVEQLENDRRRFDPQATQEAIKALEKRVIESERKITKVLSAFADLIKNEQEGVSKTPDNLGLGILENLEQLKRRIA